MNKRGAGSLTQALLIVLSINLMLWFGQLAVNEINPDGVKFWGDSDYSGSLIHQFGEANYTLKNNSIDSLPSASSSVSTEGNIFTDLFNTIKAWFVESTGLGYILGVMGAPISFLKMIGVPPEFSWGFGALWYGLTLFLIIAFIRGDSG